MAELTVPPSDNFRHHAFSGTTNVAKYHDQSQYNQAYHYANIPSSGLVVGDTPVSTIAKHANNLFVHPDHLRPRYRPVLTLGSNYLDSLVDLRTTSEA